MPQAIWRGSISFGLVTIAVRLYGAVRRKDVRFHELDRATGRRIRHQRVLELREPEPEWIPEPPVERPSSPAIALPLPPPVPVSREQMTRGYELEAGRFVEVTDQELSELAPERTRSIDIEQFISRKELDPIYFESAYYVVPEPASVRAFGLLLRALQETNRAAIGWLVLRTRRHLAAVQPRGRLMLLSTLLFADEVVPVAGLEPNLPADLSPREVETAEMLVETLSGPFEPERYRDEYRERLLALIESRSGEARPIGESPVPPPTAGVEDLMAALTASIEAARAKRQGRPRRRREG